MADFDFDDTLSFAQNCEEFLTALENVDAEFAKILRDNWPDLVSVVREGERDYKARSEFNTAIVAELDKLIMPDPQQRSV